jgi:uncharacterized protein YbgA (DUF1722 family)/uncharacterized protein YbbK (DUF523 family)
VGISACLLGRKVRFDGGHKEDPLITRALGDSFEWVPVCPEVELGLGTPRETMHLVAAGAETRLVTTRTGADLTGAMKAFARARVEDLAGADLAAFILKSDSPSCGMERVPVHSLGGMPDRPGRGLFAEALLERFPSMPVEEEGRLRDPRLRENWIERVFAYRRLQQLWRSRWTARSLIQLHTAYKLVLLSHEPRAYGSLGRLVAGAGRLPRRQLRESYEAEFMRALKVAATRGRHVNVLQHMAGYLKKKLDARSRRELEQCVEDYRKNRVLRLVPLTLIRHHARTLNVPYLAGQVYLNPDPRELALRNQGGQAP